MEAKIGRADLAAWLDRRRFEHQQTGTAQRQRPQMDQMPSGCPAVFGAVLTHRGDHDAIRQRRAAQFDRREQRRGYGTSSLGSGTSQEVRRRSPWTGPAFPVHRPCFLYRRRDRREDIGALGSADLTNGRGYRDRCAIRWTCPWGRPGACAMDKP